MINQLPKISPEQIAVYEEEIKRLSSPATARRKIISLRNYFDWAIREGITNDNPFKKVPSQTTAASITNFPVTDKNVVPPTTTLPQPNVASPTIIDQSQTGYNQSIPPTPQAIIKSESKSIFSFGNFLRGGMLAALIIIILLIGKGYRLPIPYPVVPSGSPMPSPSTTIDINIPTDAQTVRGTQELISKVIREGMVVLSDDSPSIKSIDNITGNTFNVTNSNITTGTVIYGAAPNNLDTYYLLKLESGSPLVTRFNVDAPGNTYVSNVLALAPLGIMAGKVTVDTDGNVRILGNLEVAGDTKTNATAGHAKLPAGSEDTTIKNPKVTDETLVYVTPTTPTDNLVLYVKEKTDGYFKVGFTKTIDEDVEFNWWITDLAQEP